MTDENQIPDIEITDSVPSGLKVTTEHPYRVLVVAGFAGTSENGAVFGPLADGVTTINAETFDDVMSTARPTVDFTISDPTVPGSVMVELDLRFDTLRAFDPKNVIQQIPAAKSLMSVREKTADRLRGKATFADIESEISRAVAAGFDLAWIADSLSWSPATDDDNAEAVDSILGALDLGDDENTDATSQAASAPTAKSDIGKLVTAAAQSGSSIPAEEAAALRRTLAEIDRRLAAWLTAVLHAPEVKSIECAWRSLAFLVTHTDFRKGIRLYLLHAPSADRLHRFREKLIDPVFDDGADAPDLIVIDGQFGNTAADIEALDEFAQHGASLPAVVLAGVSAGFFGVKHAWQMSTLPTIPNMFDQWQFAKFKSLRSERYARSLGVVFGRGMLRAPYGRGSDDDLALGYREQTIGEKDFVWASGAFAAAATTVRSVADTGWPTAMAGMLHGRIEGFKTGKGGKRGDKLFGPTDTQLTQPKIEEMGAIGVSAVVGIRDHPDALVWNGLTAARPMQMSPTGLLEVSLPYQLFATRLSSLLFELKPQLAGKSGDQVVKIVKQHVCDWLGYEPDVDSETLSVLTRAAEDAPNTLELAVTVTPPPSILPNGIPVVMGYRLN
ncbi:MAG: type VI secretion system contractile sheath domain-containing protein [Phycisphaerae bacterium]